MWRRPVEAGAKAIAPKLIINRIIAAPVAGTGAAAIRRLTTVAATPLSHQPTTLRATFTSAAPTAVCRATAVRASTSTTSTTTTPAVRIVGGCSPFRFIHSSTAQRQHSSGGSGGTTAARPRWSRWLAGAALGTVGLATATVVNAENMAAAAERASVMGSGANAQTVILEHVKAGAGGALESETVTAERLSSTYGYLFSSLCITAGAAFASFKSGFAASLLALNPWVLLGCSLLSGLVFVWGTQYVSYRDSPILKHVLWTGMNVSTGALLGIVGFFGSALVAKATLATACLVGGLSAVGYFAPTGTWRSFTGPLSVGLGLMCGAALGQMIWPSNSTLEHVVLYGGLAIYSAFVVADTNQMVDRAKYDPLELHRAYDPINESVKMYLNSINLFLTILDLLDRLENGDRRKRSSRRSQATLEEA